MMPLTPVKNPHRTSNDMLLSLTQAADVAAQVQSIHPAVSFTTHEHLSTSSSHGKQRVARHQPDGNKTKRHPRKTRSISSTEDEDEAPKKIRRSVQPKTRKRTYYMRKEEKQALLAELERLETMKHDFHARSVLRQQHQAIQHKYHWNQTLHDTIRGQRLAFANTISIMTQFMREQSSGPFETFIRLGKDPVRRRATLLSMKQQKLSDAIEFLRERSRFMDITKAFSDSQKFESVRGEFHAMRFDITPFRGLQSARQVFDVLLHFASNLEISISEMVGDITIREDDDDWDNTISQHRLLTQLALDVQMEMNNVMFTEFYSAEHMEKDSECLELGIMAFDFINDDELFPYRPLERLRQDITSLMMVTSYRLKKEKKQPSHRFQADVGQSASFGHRVDDKDDNEEDEELIVVLTRWTLLKLHKPAFDVPQHVMDRVSHAADQVGDAMVKIVKDSLIHVMSRKNSHRHMSIPSSQNEEMTKMSL